MKKILSKIRERVQRLRERYAAWRLARSTERHLADQGVPSVRPRRAKKRLGEAVRKTAVAVVSAGAVALLVVSPWTFFGLLYLVFTLWALLTLVVMVYNALEEVA